MTSILITGGTGSFGRAFTQHLLGQDQFTRIIVFSRGEHSQAEMADDFKSSADRLRFFIGDVRDIDRLRTAFNGVDTVIHAAALKRIEVGHYNPQEMVKTNVLGTMNVIEAAVSAGVKRVVGISSDKAWQPISPYGQSKALAETLMINANNVHGTRGPRFSVVRYGNVAGSKGSVIPIWRKLLSSGSESVPITDPGCTRFWMLMDEAVGLVHSAMVHAKGGELIFPKLPAYRLSDLASALGAKTYTVNAAQLPPWEKKHEGMGPGWTSDAARRMTVDELRVELTKV